MRTFLMICVLASTTTGFAQDSKADNKPKIILCAPLAITAGTPTKLVLRGLNLNDVTEVTIVGFDLKPPKLPPRGRGHRTTELRS